jgi:hypothetical protein
MLGVGLAVGALVGGWLGYSLGHRGGGEASALGAPPQLGELAAPAPEVAERSPAAAAEPFTAPAEPLAEAAPEAFTATASRELAPAPAGRPPRRAAPRAPRAAESSLAEELAMLQRARRALGAGNGLLALGIVQELDERFPRGVLIEERVATRVFSLCALERLAEARTIGREFLARHPSSVYAERVRTSCIEAEE